MSKKAVLVGCNYPGTKAELKGCINDVNRMYRCLIDRFGFREEDITVLIDIDKECTQPTGANIKRALNELIENARPGDVLFFHYSGHGTRLPAEGHKDDTGYDECIVPCDMNLITDEDFRGFVNKVPKGCLFTVVSDSCHSGGLIEYEKEQIGHSTSAGDDQGGHGSSSRDFSNYSRYEAPIEHGFHHHQSSHQRSQEYMQPQHGHEGYQHPHGHHVKSRSLPISTLTEILQEKTGNSEVGVGNLRPTLYGMFGANSSGTFITFTKIFMQKWQGDESEGHKMGKLFNVLGEVAMEMFHHKGSNQEEEGGGDDEEDEEEEGPKRPANTKRSLDTGVLLSGCQTEETSADATEPNTNESYGAMSNAVQTILADSKGSVSNKELVLKAREILAKQGYKQHPGLYCNDELSDAPFICDTHSHHHRSHHH